MEDEMLFGLLLSLVVPEADLRVNFNKGLDFYESKPSM